MIYVLCAFVECLLHFCDVLRMGIYLSIHMVEFTARNRNVEADTLSEKSDEQRVEEISDKFPEKIENMYVCEKRMMNLSIGSESDVKLDGSLTSRAEKNRKGVMMEADCVVENDELQVYDNMPELGHAKVAKDFEDLKPPNSNVNASVSQGSGLTMDWRNRERGEFERFHRFDRINVGGSRYSTSKVLEEGSSSYQIGSSYSYAEPMKSRNDPNGFNKVEYLEQDRAELLRKLDELKDQINRTCDVVDKPTEKVPVQMRGIHQDPYVNHYANASHFMNRNEMEINRFYPGLHSSSQVQGAGDPFRSQMLRRAPHQAPGPFQHQSSHSYVPRRYMDNDMRNLDPFDPYPTNVNFHQPSCTCFHCYHKHQVPQPVPTTAFRNKRFSDVPNNAMFYHHDKPGAFGPQDYNNPNPRFTHPPPLNSHNLQQHTRWPTDLNSEVGGGFVRHRSQRVVLVPGGRKCRPIAGGAPFLSCFNCFELLQLPKRMLLVEKHQKKMICPGCSTVIFIAIADKKLVVSGHSKIPTNAEDSSNVAVNGGSSYMNGRANWASTDFSSDEYDNSGYDFQSMDRTLLSSDPNKSTGDMRSLHSMSSCTSEEENSSGSLIDRRKQAKSAELPMKTNMSSPPQGSPLQDHFDYSNNKYNNVIHRVGKGNRSGRSEREPMKATSRQNSIKDVAMATEIDISSNEYCNTGTSQESGNGNKGSESFFAGIIKKSFKDFSRSNQTNEKEKINVTVNGHPIRDRLVKKAEKLAGPIQPGEYW